MALGVRQEGGVESVQDGLDESVAHPQRRGGKHVGYGSRAGRIVTSVGTQRGHPALSDDMREPVGVTNQCKRQLIHRLTEGGCKCTNVMCCMTPPTILRLSWKMVSPSQCGFNPLSSTAIRLCSRNHSVCITNSPVCHH